MQQVSDVAERSTVQAQYEAAMRRAREDDRDAVAETLESVAGCSQAVIGRSTVEAMRLATADDQAYASYYELLDAGIRLPSGGRWDRLRGLADLELFGNYRDRIRFAALSADGSWLTHYGPVAIVLAEKLIAHRTTVFVENSAVYFEKQRRMGMEPPVVAGSRSTWQDRGKLAVVKHIAELRPDMDERSCAKVMLRAGETSATDVFLEAHIYGSLTRRSFAKVVVKVTASTPQSFIAQLTETLQGTGVTVEVVP